MKTLRMIPRQAFLFLSLVLALAGKGWTTTKPHVIRFGKWVSAKWPNTSGEKLLDLKLRPRFVDTRLKEYTTGNPHELTDRLFVLRRVEEAEE